MENKKQSIQELVEIIATQTNFTKKFSEEFLREFSIVVQEYLEKDGFVKVKGLGTFKLVWNEERKSVNVTTGEPIIILGHNKVTFIPDSSLKEAVNKPYSHLETITLEPDTTSNDETTVVSQVQSATSEKEMVEKIVQQEIESSNQPMSEQATTHESIIEPETTPTRKKKKSVTVIVVLIIFHIAMAVALYFYKTEIVSFFQGVVGDSQESSIKEESTISTILLQPDTMVIEEEITDTTSMIVEQEESLLIEPTYSPDIAKNAPVKEYVTVNEGSRLTWIAYRVYGHKAFWVYIYDANRHQLKSPNDVQMGMELTIPDLDASLVNPNDEDCIKKALELAQEYK
jgi:nucleoid DNA-binding protein/nucleoid-associated protein YgaU